MKFKAFSATISTGISFTFVACGNPNWSKVREFASPGIKGIPSPSMCDGYPVILSTVIVKTTLLSL